MCTIIFKFHVGEFHELNTYLIEVLIHQISIGAQALKDVALRNIVFVSAFTPDIQEQYVDQNDD